MGTGSAGRFATVSVALFSFNYGGGGYLLSASNPENGTVTYTYNSSFPGKVATRVDAKGQKTAYTYDSYGRLTEVQRYPTQNGAEDTCQQEDYYYDSNPFDGGTYSNYTSGRLAAVQYYGGNIGSGCTTTFQEWYSYGVPGATTGKKMRVTRTLTKVQSPGTQVMNVDLNGNFTYDNEGRMTSEGYPTDNAGTTASLGFGFDSMGRMYSLTDQLASQTLIQSATYGPANELTQITGAPYYGAWGTETRTYNVMKQMTGLTSVPQSYGTGVSMTYNYSPTQNNGRIVSDTNGSYTYDSLNRLATFVGSGANQTFTYDGFGNLASIAGTQANTITYNPATNQGYCADANGNSTEVSCAGGYYGYTYDIENRIVQTGTAAGNFRYSYAPGNKRVWRGDGVTTDEVTFWSPSGQKLGTYALTAIAGTYSNGQFVGPFFYATQTDANYYFGGKLIKNARGWVYSDRLGSVGKYLPYGQDNGSGNPANGSEKFTGYQRDSETGNDYADQRYYGPGTARFLTPDRDAGSANGMDPASWNKYAYSGGDPVNRVDPAGTSYFQDCIQDGDCDAAFDDPLFALTIENASENPSSPCFGESPADPSDECLDSLGYAPPDDSSSGASGPPSATQSPLAPSRSYAGTAPWPWSLPPLTIPNLCQGAPWLCEVLISPVGGAITAGVVIGVTMASSNWYAGSYPTVQEIQQNCTLISERKEPATNKKARGGGTATEQKWLCPDGSVWEIQTIETENGRIIHQHPRPPKQTLGPLAALRLGRNRQMKGINQ